jgi:hypothetical protein
MKHLFVAKIIGENFIFVTTFEKKKKKKKKGTIINYMNFLTVIKL